MTEQYLAKTLLAHRHAGGRNKALALPEQQCKEYEMRVSAARPFMECKAAETS